MEKDIRDTIRYFAQFSYPPSVDEVHTFFPRKISTQELKHHLDRMTQRGLLISYTPPQYISPTSIYTIPQYSMQFEDRLARFAMSQKKEETVQSYISTLARLPGIAMVALSGSVAMRNAKEEDDVDLFIITAENQLWTGRLAALTVAQVYGIRRKRTDWRNVKDKICLNLFFDRQDLVVPRYKRSRYVGHEVLQCRPLVNKDRTYQQFLQQNDWVFSLFPNADKYKELGIKNWELRRGNSQLSTLTESFARAVQVPSIRRNTTNEIVTETQLWFFPDDYEKTIEV